MRATLLYFISNLVFYILYLASLFILLYRRSSYLQHVMLSYIAFGERILIYFTLHWHRTFSHTLVSGFDAVLRRHIAFRCFSPGQIRSFDRRKYVTTEKFQTPQRRAKNKSLYIQKRNKSLKTSESVATPSSNASRDFHLHFVFV